MAKVSTLFWDVGGVILTNGWGTASREEAARAFQLDWEDFRDRHEQFFAACEAGALTLDQYLERTLFYRARSFTREQFKGFMFAQSEPYPETRAILDQLTRSRKYRMATLNNEPLELNLYRIERFGLRERFIAFFSSCFLGVRKPDPGIYRIAMQVTQCAAERCIFIDDRAQNLTPAQELGMTTIHFQSAAQLREELGRKGVALD